MLLLRYSLPASISARFSFYALTLIYLHVSDKSWMPCALEACTESLAIVQCGKAGKSTILPLGLSAATVVSDILTDLMSE